MILVVGIVVALLLGFMYVIFMRYCAGFVVWMSVVGIILVAAAFGAWCYIKSGWIPAEWVNFVAEFLDEIGIASDFVVASSVNDSYEVLETLDIDITEFTTVSFQPCPVLRDWRPRRGFSVLVGGRFDSRFPAVAVVMSRPTGFTRCVESLCSGDDDCGTYTDHCSHCHREEDQHRNRFD